MNRRFNLVSATLFAFLLLIQPSPTVIGDPDITMVGVSEGDTFTYVLDKLVPESSTYRVTNNDTADTRLTIKEKGEFNITITNATLVLGDSDYQIETQFTNGTHTESGIIEFSSIDFILFTDWAFYEVNFTAALQELLDTGEIDSFEVINSVSEYGYNWNGSISSDTFLYFEFIFDKVTGMQLYSKIELKEGEFQLLTILRQKGYVHPSNQTITILTSTGGEINTNSTTTSITNSLTTSETDSETSDGLSLPTFQFVTIGTALFVAVFTLRRKK